MGWIHHLEEALKSFSTAVPVELFTLLGTFIEEIIAPIPSPLVMAMAGSIAFAQERSFVFLFWLSLIGALGKTAGGWVVYFLVVKIEDIVVGRFGKFLGVSPKDIENLSRVFHGGLRDFSVLFILRSAPVVPSSPVSVVCGVVKMDLRTYLVASFFGALIRNWVFLYIGYAGVAAYASLLKGFENAESVIEVVIVAAVVALLGWIYYKRGKGDIWEWFRSKFSSRPRP